MAGPSVSAVLQYYHRHVRRIPPRFSVKGSYCNKHPILKALGYLRGKESPRLMIALQGSQVAYYYYYYHHHHHCVPPCAMVMKVITVCYPTILSPSQLISVITLSTSRPFVSQRSTWAWQQKAPAQYIRGRP
jgi:hypothetical protein